ncbi:hypothetical protein HYX15_02365 [Candidatus Woesearchaeota archaeon]|nr:hypothetical protein [Candidatus Woesearchaeota archaeon]
MGNTILCKTEDEKAYGWYRFFDGSKVPFHGVTCDINSLVVNMKSNAYLFEEPFDIETKVPEINFGSLDKSLFGLISIDELKEVRQALGLSENSS